MVCGRVPMNLGCGSCFVELWGQVVVSWSITRLRVCCVQVRVSPGQAQEAAAGPEGHKGAGLRHQQAVAAVVGGPVGI